MWDQLERGAILEWTCTGGKVGNCDQLAKGRKQQNLIKKISCPVLVVAGEYDFIDTKYMLEYCKGAGKAGSDIQLKIFSAGETGASHAQIDNPTLSHEFVFDWIADQMRRNRDGSRVRRLTAATVNLANAESI
jgi:pimeloyl-ACP methyl ester carboxylesterase